MQIKSIAQFAEVCKSLNSDEIYELFEFDLSEDMRGRIYAIADDKDAFEPCRFAMHAIGVEYDVESLKNY